MRLNSWLEPQRGVTYQGTGVMWKCEQGTPDHLSNAESIRTNSCPDYPLLLDDGRTHSVIYRRGLATQLVVIGINHLVCATALDRCDLRQFWRGTPRRSCKLH